MSLARFLPQPEDLQDDENEASTIDNTEEQQFASSLRSLRPSSKTAAHTGAMGVNPESLPEAHETKECRWDAHKVPH